MQQRRYASNIRAQRFNICAFKYEKLRNFDKKEYYSKRHHNTTKSQYMHNSMHNSVTNSYAEFTNALIYYLLYSSYICHIPSKCYELMISLNYAKEAQTATAAYTTSAVSPLVSTTPLHIISYKLFTSAIFFNFGKINISTNQFNAT